MTAPRLLDERAPSASSASVALSGHEFPAWLRWGQRQGAFVDHAAILALRPNHKHWTQKADGTYGYIGDAFHCGWCLAPLSGRRTSWCSDECSRKFGRVWSWGAVAKYVRARDRDVCQRCGTMEPGAAKGARYDAWDVDHIVPVKDGGTDDPANLRLLCCACHVAIGYEQRAARRASLTMPDKPNETGSHGTTPTPSSVNSHTPVAPPRADHEDTR